MAEDVGKAPSDASARPRLLDEFGPTTHAEWKIEAERLLRGAPFASRMLTPTPEGITLQPIYGAQDVAGLGFVDSLPGFPPYVRGTECWRSATGGWQVAQEYGNPTSTEFNRELRRGLERGLTAVNLSIDAAGRRGFDPDQAPVGEVGWGGVSIATTADLAQALAGVDLGRTPIYLQAGQNGLPYLALLVTLAGSHGVKPAALRGAVAMDPLGELVTRGWSPQALELSYACMAEMTGWAVDHAPELGTVWCHGEPYHDGGGHAVQELAFTLATAVEYLRRLESHKLDVTAAAPHLRFSFALGGNFFMEIAKLRAARLLWYRILESCDVPAPARTIWIHAGTSRYTKTLHDPYVNLLRTTTEALSGVVGGADSMHVTPFDAVLRCPDEFSERLACNTQTIIRDEAHLGEIQDPAGGSWYVEDLTGEVAQASWRLLQAVEKLGGMGAALTAGFPQEEITRVAAAREQAAATRRQVIVGTNQYADPTESPLPARPLDYQAIRAARISELHVLHATPEHQQATAVLDQLQVSTVAAPSSSIATMVEAASRGATIGEMARARCGSASEQNQIEPLPRRRAAAGFEALRSAVTAHAAAAGALKVFVATLGPVARYRPRVDFTTALFTVGGFEVVRAPDDESSPALVAAALAARPAVVVICGHDESYLEAAPRLARLVRSGKRDLLLMLAGKPPDAATRARLQEAGVEFFIQAGMDVLKLLRDVAGRLGVAS